MTCRLFEEGGQHGRYRREFIAILSTNEGGPVERRAAGTRKQAFAAARVLLDVAEGRTWNLGEAVSVEVRQAEQ